MVEKVKEIHIEKDGYENGRFNITSDLTAYEIKAVKGVSYVFTSTHMGDVISVKIDPEYNTAEVLAEIKKLAHRRLTTTERVGDLEYGEVTPNIDKFQKFLPELWEPQLKGRKETHIFGSDINELSKAELIESIQMLSGKIDVMEENAHTETDMFFNSVSIGSGTVKINKKAARVIFDMALICDNDGASADGQGALIRMLKGQFEAEYSKIFEHYSWYIDPLAVSDDS